MTQVIIDSHHHFWDPTTADYPWMTGDASPLRRPFGPDDLAPLLEVSGVRGTVVVQARQEFDETAVLLRHAAENDWILGVVGWVDLTTPDVDEALARARSLPAGERLVGVRHLVHDEADPEWLLRDDVQAGLEAVADAGLVFDLLVRERELPAATEVARRLPQLRFVVDHLAKPRIAARASEPWASRLSEIARFENVVCKVSGLVTEADRQSWRSADLAPYIGAALDMFGPQRLMWGSDWPVCTLVANYRQVLDATLDVLTEHLGDDLDELLWLCATRVYGIPPPV